MRRRFQAALGMVLAATFVGSLVGNQAFADPICKDVPFFITPQINGDPAVCATPTQIGVVIQIYPNLPPNSCNPAETTCQVLFAANQLAFSPTGATVSNACQGEACSPVEGGRCGTGGVKVCANTEIQADGSTSSGETGATAGSIFVSRPGGGEPFHNCNYQDGYVDRGACESGIQVFAAGETPTMPSLLVGGTGSNFVVAYALWAEDETTGVEYSINDDKVSAYVLGDEVACYQVHTLVDCLD